MNGLFSRYQALHLDTACIDLEPGTLEDPYFCYPVGAEAIGFEGCILYCFLPEYGDMVFAANPESCGEQNVYPLARSFRDFLRLVLACGSPNPAEQAVWMRREQFDAARAEVLARQTGRENAVLTAIADAFSLTPMEDPYGYVQQVQAETDCSRIVYSSEYYDVLGLEDPQGASDDSELPPCCPADTD